MRIPSRTARRGNSMLSTMSLCLLLAGCVMEPVTGRKRLIFTPKSMENELGLKSWTQILEKEKISDNALRTAAVRRVGTTLSRAVDAPGYQWEFRLFQSEQANAFCLPGGKIAVYEGLFDVLANDAELAAVVGHEIAHATARHGGERMSQAVAVNLGLAAVGVATRDQSAQQRDRWLLAYTGVSTIGLLLPYSRIHEYAADEIGLIYMARAGYDPRAAVDFWTRFAASKGKQHAFMEFLSTHPIDEKRIARLQKAMPAALAEYGRAPVNHGHGETY